MDTLVTVFGWFVVAVNVVLAACVIGLAGVTLYEWWNERPQDPK